MLECPQFDDIRAQYPDLLQDARDTMRNLMWHQNQKALSDFVIAILDEPRTSWHEHGLILVGLAGPMDVVTLSLSLSLMRGLSLHHGYCLAEVS